MNTANKVSSRPIVTKKMLMRHSHFISHASWLVEVKARGFVVCEKVDNTGGFMFDSALDENGKIQGSCFRTGPEFGWMNSK